VAKPRAKIFGFICNVLPKFGGAGQVIRGDERSGNDPLTLATSANPAAEWCCFHRIEMKRW
jgi:hypothetical protein